MRAFLIKALGSTPVISSFMRVQIAIYNEKKLTICYRKDIKTPSIQKDNDLKVR
ncbi:unnamed protein product [Acidithrix sp. C25]|nr:unnamed protein product [Acidithrix sp. C25]